MFLVFLTDPGHFLYLKIFWVWGVHCYFEAFAMIHLAVFPSAWVGSLVFDIIQEALSTFHIIGKGANVELVFVFENALTIHFTITEISKVYTAACVDLEAFTFFFALLRVADEPRAICHFELT